MKSPKLNRAVRLTARRGKYQIDRNLGLDVKWRGFWYNGFCREFKGDKPIGEFACTSCPIFKTEGQICFEAFIGKLCWDKLDEAIPNQFAMLIYIYGFLDEELLNEIQG